MLDPVIGFFSHFQEKDWVTFGFSMAAFAVSLWTAHRRHWFDKVKHLEMQADFTAEWLHYVDMQNLSIQLTNVGNGPAFNVRFSSPSDPTHILGLHETAQGPMNKDQFMFQYFRGTIHQAQSGILTSSGLPIPWKFQIDWTDLYGQQRRQIIEGGAVKPARNINSLDWEQLQANPLLYRRGAIGSGSYQDLKLLPRAKRRTLRRNWVDRYDI